MVKKVDIENKNTTRANRQSIPRNNQFVEETMKIPDERMILQYK